MTDLTMIGLGAMGSALATAFLQAGHDLTVWNRTAENTEPFITLGAKCASSVSEAVEASPVVVICIDNYAITRKLISENNLGKHLSGRVLVQLSTGTPKESQELSELISSFNCEYIDGAIMPYPDEVGAADAKFLFAGRESAYQQCLPFLDCLGGDLRYLGTNISAAAALDMALLTHDLCNFLGAIHGARLCEAEGISVATFSSMFPQDHTAREPLNVIHSGNYTNPGATLSVWEGALQRIQTQARDVNINAEIPDLISSLFKRAIAAGYGEQDVAAIIKVLRAECGV